MATASRASARDTHDENGTTGAEQNRLLRALSPDVYDRVLSHLEPVELRHRHVVWEPNEPIETIYFPRTGVISVLVVLDKESSVEAATIGREGVVGLPVALGAERTASRCIAQIPGSAARISSETFREQLDAEPELARLILRYGQALIEQTSQSVACNARHSMDERCARWLLMSHDRVGSDQFSLTHEFLAMMLGVRRASVTVAAGMLQQAGLIRYTRGKITVLDRARLEEASCECYRVVKTKADELLGPDLWPWQRDA